MGASCPTGGVVADVCVRAGAGHVVREDGGEVGVATHAEEWAGGFSGVTRHLRPIVPLYEGHVVLHQWHLIPNHRAVACCGLLHPDVLWGTWIWEREIEDRKKIRMGVTC